MNLKLKHEDLVANYNAIITLIFIFYYRLHCFSVPTAPEQRKTTSSSLAGERGGGEDSTIASKSINTERGSAALVLTRKQKAIARTSVMK